MTWDYVATIKERVAISNWLTQRWQIDHPMRQEKWVIGSHPVAKRRRQGWGTQGEGFPAKGWAIRPPAFGFKRPIHHPVISIHHSIAPVP